jgi:hypothetical protein
MRFVPTEMRTRASQLSLSRYVTPNPRSAVQSSARSALTRASGHSLRAARSRTGYGHGELEPDETHALPELLGGDDPLFGCGVVA